MIGVLGAKDVIAFVALLGVFISQIAGFADTLTNLIAMGVGFYIGHRKSGQDTGK